MAKMPANRARIYLNRFDISGFANSYSLEVAQETIPVTTLADAGPRRLVGTYDHSHSDGALFDGVDDSIDEIVHTLLGSAADHYLSELPEGATEGAVAYDALVMLSKKPLSGAGGGAVMLGLDTEGSGGLSRGLVLGAATVSGAGNRTGRNQGATVAGQQYRVVFRLLAFTGTNITLTVQESQNDGSPDAYAAVAGLTSGALTGVGVVVASTTAATEAWKRLAITGTFTSALILVTAGVVAGT